MPGYTLSIAEVGRRLRRHEITASALVEEQLRRIHELDGLVHAFIRVTAEQARADAARADAEISAGIDRGPLHGIPYGLKDIFDVAGIPTTCNSRLMLDYVPAHDAAIVERLKAGGAVLIGKLNTHEFAFGGPGFDLPFPPARNPWNLECFTGGSSSGCGAAVAAGFTQLAFGSDTGGSLRSPAAHCGVVALKPTYGRVSRRGVYPLSYSLDHCGPITWSVQDAALAMNVVSGYDPLDPSSVNVPGDDFAAQIGGGVEGLRIAYARALFASENGVSPDVVAAVDRAAGVLASLGGVVEEVQLADFELFKACGRVILTAEAYAVQEQDLKTRPLEYGRYTYQRLAAGATLTAADFVQALRLRRELTVEIERRVFSKYDVLLTATALTPARPLAEFPHDWPPPALAVAVQTVPFNVTGHPALAIPVGFSDGGLPIGAQIVGRAFGERALLGVGAALEGALGVTHRRPDLVAVGASC